jgi:predicted cupin superfamily sugar epimerase
MTAGRARVLIDALALEPHPEGGYYRQLHRSDQLVLPADGRGHRPSLTTIYFLLPEGAFSRWHRVASDEVWHHYEGAPLELLELTADLSRLMTLRLGPLELAMNGAGLKPRPTHEGSSQSPVHTIPAGHWQAARTTGAYTLVGCTVGPGFDFADFAMLADDREKAPAVAARHPAAASLL